MDRPELNISLERGRTGDEQVDATEMAVPRAELGTTLGNQNEEEMRGWSGRGLDWSGPGLRIGMVCRTDVLDT